MPLMHTAPDDPKRAQEARGDPKRAQQARADRQPAEGARGPRVVLITAPAGEPALALARGLIERRLAACVNLIGGVTSVYRWEGALAEDPETLCVAKTTADRVPEIERWLAANHPYDVPECVALAPASVEARYLEWLAAETRPGLPEP